MRKRKVATAPSETATLTLGLSPNLRDSLKLLSASRKAGKKVGGRPIFIVDIVDVSIIKLAAMLKSGAEVSFIPVPRSSSGRTSLRVSARGHRTAIQASENADVKLADFIRTALSNYIRSHASEIYEKTKTPAHRGRK